MLLLIPAVLFSVPALADGCLAKDEVAEALSFVDGALKTVISDIEALPVPSSFQDIKDTAIKMATDADNALVAMEDDACPTCEKMHEMFDVVKGFVDFLSDW